MAEKIEVLKIGISFFMSVMSKMMKGSSREIAVLLLLIAADTVIGWIKAIKKGEWRSNKARIGFMGKVVELILIVCLYALDWLFDTNVLKFTGIYYFGICEISSILENYAQINQNLPDGLVEIFHTLRKSVASGIVKNVKSFADNNEEKNKE